MRFSTPEPQVLDLASRAMKTMCLPSKGTAVALSAESLRAERFCFSSDEQLAQFIRHVFMSLNNAICVWVHSPPQHVSGQPMPLHSGQRQNNTQSFVLGPGSWLQGQ